MEHFLSLDINIAKSGYREESCTGNKSIVKPPESNGKSNNPFFINREPLWRFRIGARLKQSGKKLNARINSCTIFLS